MRGIVIACPNKYELFCLNNIQQLRKMNCKLPIEIWEIGNEISIKTKNEMKSLYLWENEIYRFKNNLDKIILDKINE